MLFFRRGLMQTLHWGVTSLKWRHIILIVIVHWHAAWLLQLLTEPNAEFASYGVYWYFYFVTALTVGYGDFSPTLMGSRLSTVFFVGVPGILLIGAMLGKVGTLFFDASEKIKKGLMQQYLENHIIVIGDGSDRTLDLLHNLMADPTVGDVLLVSLHETNPMIEKLKHFVSGDVSDSLVQEKANFRKARQVIVLGDDDTVVGGRALQALHCTGDDTRVLAYYQHEAASEPLRSLARERLQIVTSVSMDLLVQEALDPGAAAFIRELLRNEEGGTFIRCMVPDGIETTWAMLGWFLMERDFNPLCLYVDGSPVAMPKGSSCIRTGDFIGIAATDRLQLQHVDWSTLQNAT